MHDKFYMTDDEYLDRDYMEDTEDCLGPARVIYFILQTMLLLVGAYLAYYCYRLYGGLGVATDSQRTFGSIVKLGVLTGFGIAFYAVFGMTSVLMKSRKMGTAYVALVIIGVFLSIWAIWWVQVRVIQVRGSMDGIWDGMSEASRSKLQVLGNCCGFSGDGDRAIDPCPVSADGPCFPAGEPSPVLAWLRGILLFALSSIFCFGFILAIVNIFILFVHSKEKHRPDHY